MAIRDRRAWRLALLWLAVLALEGWLASRAVGAFRATPAGARGGLVAVAIPLWAGVTMAALLVGALLLTRHWRRGRTGPG